MPLDPNQSESQPAPEQIEASEVEDLIALAEQGQLDAAAQRRVAPLLRTLLWLQHSLLETRISLSKLKRILFGKPTEKSRRKPPDDPPPDAPPEPPDAHGDAETQTEQSKPTDNAAAADTPSAPPGDAEAPSGKPDKPPPPGHGRLGAADYPGAEVEFCAHDDLAPGDQCPACGRGKLYPMPPLVRLRFTGQPLVAVTRYDLERLRCNACGGLFVAHLPPGATTERYDISLKVMLAVAHYHLGLPFNRIEALQQMLGLPLRR